MQFRSRTSLLLCIPVLLFFSSPITTALVSVPHRLPVQTLTRSLRKELLYLETSPLIGGPSWLPLHVTVVLAVSNREDGSTVEHRYDLIPQHPTDPQTVRTLLTLGTVPATVRSRRVTKSATDNEQQIPMGVLPDFGLVLMEEEEEADIDGGREEDTVLGAESNSSLLLTTTATMFCARYPGELHLLRANCWTFAWELYDVLEEEQARQAAC